MVRGVHTKSRANTPHKSDPERPAKVAQYFLPLPKRSKLRSVLVNQDDKGFLQKRRTGEAAPRAEKSGDLITADHKVLNEEGESRNNHRYAVVVQDLATQ